MNATPRRICTSPQALLTLSARSFSRRTWNLPPWSYCLQGLTRGNGLAQSNSFHTSEEEIALSPGQWTVLWFVRIPFFFFWSFSLLLLSRSHVSYESTRERKWERERKKRPSLILSFPNQREKKSKRMRLLIEEREFDFQKSKRHDRNQKIQEKKENKPTSAHVSKNFIPCLEIQRQNLSVWKNEKTP